MILYIVLHGVPDPRGKGSFGGWTPSQNLQFRPKK